MGFERHGSPRYIYSVISRALCHLAICQKNKAITLLKNRYRVRGYRTKSFVSVHPGTPSRFHCERNKTIYRVSSRLRIPAPVIYVRPERKKPRFLPTGVFYIYRKASAFRKGKLVTSTHHFYRAIAGFVPYKSQHFLHP